MSDTFPPQLWDDSDKQYAPCLQWLSDGTRAYWIAPKRYIKAGYTNGRYSLGVGDKTAPIPHEWASKCRALTRSMVRWYKDTTPAFPLGTWRWLIWRYRSDAYSPYQSVKANSRTGYDQVLAQIIAIVGKRQVNGTTYESLMDIMARQKKSGRSVDFIHRWFNTLRRVARYGVLIDAPGAKRVADILANMRIRKPAPRSVAPTRDHVMAIVSEAEKAGLHVPAMGWLFQWWFQLRAVDVRGQYLDGVWSDGLTWEMFSDDLSSFDKVISKTRQTMPEAYHFNLAMVPELRARVGALYASLPACLRSGAITIHPTTGKPYTPRSWAGAWARCRKAAGVPSEIWMTDTRAGALTEAGRIAEVTVPMLVHAGQHRRMETTDRYLRLRSDDLEKVVALRRAN